jgi:preprotein translocase subunit SecA
MVREDSPDFIYKTIEGKWRAVAADIQEHHESGRPVLVGTTSIEDSEKLSSLLNKHGISHQVLNAKQHEMEANIIVQAGRPGSITVATNMAGRGTDIVLGGNSAGLDITPEEWKRDHDLVLSLGGLHVIGTDHHEARRIDNQLRGRSGRQGDPGSSRFYASLEDELLRRFGGDRIKSIMSMVGLDEDTPIENRIVTKSLESAQVKVEGTHFDARKHLLEYDDVLNNQRQTVYAQRRRALTHGDLKETILEMIHKEIKSLISKFLPGKYAETWDIRGFLDDIGSVLSLPNEWASEEKLPLLSKDEIEDRLTRHADDMYGVREAQIGSDDMRVLERLLMLRTVDIHWLHHLTAMDNLRQGIGLQAYGQRDPLVMYKTEGSRMFQELLDRIQRDIVHAVYQVSLSPARETRKSGAQERSSPMAAVSGQQKNALPVGGRKTGRNEPCPCGSGKKYKRCHGANS